MEFASTTPKREIVSEPDSETMYVGKMKELVGNDILSRNPYETPVKSPFSLLSLASYVPNAPTKKSQSGGTMFEIAPDVPVLNHALREIGLNVLEQYFEALYSVTQEPVVSVGSGNGHIERHMEKLFGRDILCVDPNHVPNSNPDLYKTSQFDNVEHLLESRNDLVGNSTLFLNWSTPNDPTWDYDAIHDLSPNHVVIVFESTGSGGSQLLHKWLKFCGVVTDQELIGSEVEVHGFTKYHPVKSTISRLNKPPHGMFEYEILWLSKVPTVVNTDHIPNHVGTLIERKAWNPLDNLLDSLLSNVRTIAQSANMGEYWDHIESDIKKSNSTKVTQKLEKLQFGGFLKPATELDETTLNTMKSQIDSMNVGDVIECHHPFYREQLRLYASERGIKLQSSVDDSLRKHDDSMLLFHNECKKCTPVAKVRWYPDYYTTDPGRIYQMQANCEHCSGKILTNYKGEKHIHFGYKYVRGKNCLKRVAQT